MSKIISIPIGTVASQTDKAFSAISKAARAVRKKISEKWESLSPEDRRYLLPFGADAERMNLERATFSYEPLGLDFGKALPAFAEASGSNQEQLVQRSHLLPEAAEEEAFYELEALLGGMGFKAERRALPEDSSVLILDIFKDEREPELVAR